ncbi:carboxymuconolactone decarboxylase family protein [Lentzea sp. PSKA42]|uniref:Carboxymuconolactone decarboxylase family protein n=1 Tax=Lentzea indica TaxID=2604800 RepID=A0ABX1FSN3_9PSEU|nr:carboxymuconolactone decarboxylase family protein [Lentzea indica]NKE61834.1 carboxymuconolactone decarboxylase family protein [Lentzea indica]
MSTITSEPRVNLKSVTPDVSAAMRALHVAAADSAARAGLPVLLLDLLRLRVSQINGCEFCMDLHARDARAAGESPERLDALFAWPASTRFDAREKAALALAEAITLVHDGRVPDGVYRAAATEFGEDGTAALIWVCTVINAYNRIAVSTRMVPPAPQPSTQPSTTTSS